MQRRPRAKQVEPLTPQPMGSSRCKWGSTRLRAKALCLKAVSSSPRAHEIWALSDLKREE